jgi:hypothetical protein
MAKRFFYVCLGLLALAAAYHLGASSAQSQATGTFVSLAPGPGDGSREMYALTSNGDFYGMSMSDMRVWTYWGNVAGGVSTQSATWGGIKAQFK